MNLHELKKIILSHNKPELAEQTGMVYQVWDDGEITLQKSGPLLWNRHLHQMNPPLESYKSIDEWPDKLKDNGFIFTDRSGAEAVRELLKL